VCVKDVEQETTAPKRCEETDTSDLQGKSRARDLWRGRPIPAPLHAQKFRRTPNKGRMMGAEKAKEKARKQVT